MKIQNITKLSRASQLSLVGLVILLGAVFITVNSAQQQQDERSRASTGGCVQTYTSGQPWVKKFSDYPSVYHVTSLTVGGMTIVGEAADHTGGDLITSDIFPIGANPLPGRSLLMSGTENFTVNFSTPVYGFAFAYFEPRYHPSVNIASSAIVDTTFQVTLSNNGVAVYTFTFNGPNDVVSTQGIWLDKQFNKAVFRDLGNSADNEIFGAMYWITSPSCLPTPTPTKVPTATPTRVATATPTTAATPTPTRVPTVTPTPTRVPTATPTTVAAPTATKTPTPTVNAPTLTPTVFLTPTPTNSPTATPAPTNTPVPGNTSVNIAMLLHGIGKGGDSANPNALGNATPLRPQRTISVEIFNASNQLVTTKTGNVSFNSTAGNFQGSIDLGSQFSSGLYTMKVKSDQYLRGLVPGIQTITKGQSNSLPSLTLVAGDANGDNQINIVDYNLLVGCYSDLLPAVDCVPQNEILTDFNDDGHTNQIDYNLFLRELTNIGGQ